MPEAFEDIAYTVGGGLVSPGIGAAELALGLLVGLAFAWSALRAGLPGRHHHQERGGPKRHC